MHDIECNEHFIIEKSFSAFNTERNATWRQGQYHGDWIICWIKVQAEMQGNGGLHRVIE